jgi:hypothetical protein
MEKLKNKKAIEEQDCKTKREQYIKYKLDKLILLQDIKDSLPAHRVEYLRNKIEWLLALKRGNSNLLSELKKPIDQISGLCLILIIENMSDLAKNYIHKDEGILKKVVKHLMINNPKKFKECVCSIYKQNMTSLQTKQSLLSKLQNPGDRVVEEEKIIQLAKKQKRERGAILSHFDKMKELPESLSDQIIRDHWDFFKSFIDSDFDLNELNETIFLMLSDGEKVENLEKAKKKINLEFEDSNNKLNKLLETYFSFFDRSDNLFLSISNDFDLVGASYELPIKSIVDLSGEAVQKLNSVAIAQNKGLPLLELSFDPFDDGFATNPTSSSAQCQRIEIHAQEAFKNECAQRLGAIGKKWNENKGRIFLVGERLKEENIRNSLKNLLKLDDNESFKEIDDILLEEALNQISSQRLSLFENIEQYFKLNSNFVKDKSVHKDIDNQTWPSLITALVKEQKKHVFKRFTLLNGIYEGFVRDAKLIINAADNISPGAGQHVSEIICSILEDSHKEATSTTVADTHHSKSIMGNRCNDVAYDSVTKACENLNEILLLPVDHAFRKNPFEHAHTFPFPAVVNWKISALKKMIEEKGYDLDSLDVPVDGTADFLLRPGIMKEQFNEFKKDLEKKLPGSFEKEIETLKNKLHDNPAHFIFASLTALSTVYLYALSETQHLPSFINQEVDSISEWRLSETESYKSCIKTSLIEMIKTPSNGSGKTFDKNFDKYIPRTLDKASQKEKEWIESAKNGVDNGLIYKVLQIFVLQTKQAALAAI